MQNGYIIDTPSSVDIQENVKIGGKVIEIFEGVIYRETFKISPSRNVTGKLFAFRQKHKKENIDVMQVLVELIMISLYGEQIRKEITYFYECKSEKWMMSEYDERIKEYWRTSQGDYIVKMIDDKGLGDEVKNLKTMPLHLGSFVISNSPLHLGAFVLSNSKRIMNIFIHAIDGFKTNGLYNEDTDSMYNENKHWNK